MTGCLALYIRSYLKFWLRLSELCVCLGVSSVSGLSIWKQPLEFADLIFGLVVPATRCRRPTSPPSNLLFPSLFISFSRLFWAENNWGPSQEIFISEHLSNQNAQYNILSRGRDMPWGTINCQHVFQTKNGADAKRLCSLTSVTNSMRDYMSTSKS